MKIPENNGTKLYFSSNHSHFSRWTLYDLSSLSLSKLIRGSFSLRRSDSHQVQRVAGGSRLPLNPAPGSPLKQSYEVGSPVPEMQPKVVHDRQTSKGRMRKELLLPFTQRLGHRRFRTIRQIVWWHSRRVRTMNPNNN